MKTCICGYCDREYQQGDMFYDDLCDDCAKDAGILDDEDIVEKMVVIKCKTKANLQKWL